MKLLRKLLILTHRYLGIVFSADDADRSDRSEALAV